MSDTSAKSSRFQEELRAAINRLSKDGWTVEVEPSTVPTQLKHFRPDFIARRGEEILVGEVKFRGEKELGSLEALTHAVEQIPHANLEMIWLGEAEEPPSEDDVVSMATTALDLAAISAAGAMLLAWASLEGALEKRGGSYPIGTELQRTPNARQRLSTMANLGELSEIQFRKLYLASKERNALAHGVNRTPQRDSIEYVAQTAIAIARDTHFSIEEMIEWFLENYKIPGEGVPFDGREGGYQYVAGGPHSADDVLTARFDHMPIEDIDAAVEQIESESVEWVRREDY